MATYPMDEFHLVGVHGYSASLVCPFQCFTIFVEEADGLVAILHGYSCFLDVRCKTLR